jgi:hypothetical protein
VRQGVYGLIAQKRDTVFPPQELADLRSSDRRNRRSERALNTGRLTVSHSDLRRHHARRGNGHARNWAKRRGPYIGWWLVPKAGDRRRSQILSKRNNRVAIVEYDAKREFLPASFRQLSNS